MPRFLREELRPMVFPIAVGSRAHDVVYDMRPAPTGAPALAPAADLHEWPSVSIVVVTYENQALTRLCLESLARSTAYPSYEVIVVDNGSRDGTPELLAELARRDSRLRIHLNPSNRGFAAASNQGIQEARGDYVVFLNNDTVLPPHWLRRLLAPMISDPAIGLCGPVTNRITNRAQVPVPYVNLLGMERFATERATEYGAAVTDIPVLALYCAAGRRTELLDIGLLDERFEVGMFEDDDLCRRYESRGRRRVIALGCFVHHFGHASLGKLSDTEFLRIWEANRRRYEQKWGPWRPPIP